MSLSKTAGSRFGCRFQRPRSNVQASPDDSGLGSSLGHDSVSDMGPTEPEGGDSVPPAVEPTWEKQGDGRSVLIPIGDRSGFQVPLAVIQFFSETYGAVVQSVDVTSTDEASFTLQLSAP